MHVRYGLCGCVDAEEMLERARFRVALREMVVLSVVLESLRRLRESGVEDPLGELERILTEALDYSRTLLYRHAPSLESPIALVAGETASTVEAAREERLKAEGKSGG